MKNPKSFKELSEVKRKREESLYNAANMSLDATAYILADKLRTLNAILERNLNDYQTTSN